MTHAMPPAAQRPIRLGARDTATRRHDILALLALGLVIGLACRGHFVMPHPDFLAFVDSGHAWLSGELPATLKRAPLFPLLVVTLAKPLPVEAADRAVAEWLNVLLLPLNGVLVYLIGRRWFGAGARWAALWFLLLPLGMYCTAHVIVEPLLTGLILLTILAVQRGSGWAYVAAAAATMTRYDAAGLIVGVGLADLLCGRTLRRTALRTALAGLPLILWLLLTALTWSGRGEEHYLAQMAEQPTLDPGWSFGVIARTCFDPHLLRLPAWLAAADLPTRWLIAWGPLVMALAGVILKLRRRDGAVLAIVVAFAGYVGVHAVFPFQMDRFGYPMAAALILLAGVGIHWAGGALRGVDPRSVAVRLVLIVVAIVLTAALLVQAQTFATAAGHAGRLGSRAGLLMLVCVVAVWSAPLVLRRWRLRQMVLLLALVLLAAVQTGQGTALIGTGTDLKNNVEAARWIRDNAPPEARVLSAWPGLLRLYAGRELPDRFVGFWEIESQAWPEIIAECRQRHIDYIIWHDQLWQEHGRHYGERWRLERFDPLATPDTAPGVRPQRYFPKRPNVVIVRVEAHDDTP